MRAHGKSRSEVCQEQFFILYLFFHISSFSFYLLSSLSAKNNNNNDYYQCTIFSCEAAVHVKRCPSSLKLIADVRKSALRVIVIMTGQWLCGCICNKLVVMIYIAVVVVIILVMIIIVVKWLKKYLLVRIFVCFLQYYFKSVY